MRYDLNVDGETPIDGKYWITIHGAGRKHTARHRTRRSCRYWVRGVPEKDLEARVNHERECMRREFGRRMDIRFCGTCGGG